MFGIDDACVTVPEAHTNGGCLTLKIYDSTRPYLVISPAHYSCFLAWMVCRFPYFIMLLCLQACWVHARWRHVLVVFLIAHTLVTLVSNTGLESMK